MNFVTSYQSLEPNHLVQLPSGLLVSETLAEEYYLNQRRPVAIDLFAGCGGASLGVTEAGFDVLAASDNDALATMTYMTNLGAYPCKFHFATDEDAERLNKALEREWKRNGKDGIDRACVSGSAWISHRPEL